MIIQAIINLGWDKAVSEEAGVINWFGEEGLPQKSIDAEVARLQLEYNNLEYARLRKTEYDNLNQDELRYNDLENNTTTWPDAIKDIKARFPK